MEFEYVYVCAVINKLGEDAQCSQILEHYPDFFYTVCLTRINIFSFFLTVPKRKNAKMHPRRMGNGLEMNLRAECSGNP